MIPPAALLRAFLPFLRGAGFRAFVASLLQALPPAGRETRFAPYCAAIFVAAGAKSRSISRRIFTAVRLSSIATSA